MRLVLICESHTGMRELLKKSMQKLLLKKTQILTFCISMFFCVFLIIDMIIWETNSIILIYENYIS